MFSLFFILYFDFLFDVPKHNLGQSMTNKNESVKVLEIPGELICCSRRKKYIFIEKKNYKKNFQHGTLEKKLKSFANS